MKKIIAITAMLAVSTMGFASFASADELVQGYVTNSYGEVYKNSSGECWRDSFTTTTEKKVECGYPAPVVVVSQCPDNIIVQNLYFDFDSATISTATKIDIMNIRTQIKEANDSCAPIKHITITGNTDSTGPSEYNYNLGLRRAEALKTFLTSLGTIAIIDTLSDGETNPMHSNNNATGRSRNRRCIVVITSK